MQDHETELGIMDDDKLTRLKGEIGRRLRQVCTHMTEQDFEEMVQKIADNELRAERRMNQEAGRPGGA